MRFWKSPNTKDAYRLSWVSLACTLIGAFSGLALFMKTGSSLCLTFSLENFVDFLSSAAVLWRFFAPSSVDAQIEGKLHRREQRASMGISFVLVLLGAAVFLGALFDFTEREDDPEKLDAVVGFAGVSIFVLGGLTMFKFHYANILESPSLYKDGLCSLIGTILSGTLFVNSLLIREYPQFWWIDPTVSLFCGIGAGVLGGVQIYEARCKENLPIFTLSWWFTSQGDKQETTSREGDAEMMPAPPPAGTHNVSSGADLV